MQPGIAELLARCFVELEVWELANSKRNRAWKCILGDKWARALRDGCARHAATHLEREQAFARRLAEPDQSPLGRLLSDTRTAVLDDVERDINMLSISAA